MRIIRLFANLCVGNEHKDEGDEKVAQALRDERRRGEKKEGKQKDDDDD